MIVTLKPLTECHVLIVDDDDLTRTALMGMLADEYQCQGFENGELLLEFCEIQIPDLILLDVHMPRKSGLEVCRELKQNDAMRNVPILFVTGNYDTPAQNACWEAGASDFIGKPVAASTLIHRTRHHLENKLRLIELERLTFRDQLTGLYNRHYLEHESQHIIGTVNRNRSPIGLLMVDVDYFKQYNDRYGHLVGDKCLQRVTRAFSQVLKRPQDIVVRYGGEEFLVILPDTDAYGVQYIANRLLHAIKSTAIPHECSSYQVITVSIGIAYSDGNQKVMLEELISVADEALYCAKEQGRNKVVGF